jgi:activating signal cointegrator 1
MKAISMWEPYASLVSVSAKKNETRSFPISYRGDLLICASKVKHLPPPELCEWLWDNSHLFGVFREFDELWNGLPFGKAVCIVEVYDCQPTSFFHGAVPLKLSQQEAMMGDYTPGRFAWLTRNCRRFKQPFPVTGRQGFFNVPDELVNKALTA